MKDSWFLPMFVIQIFYFVNNFFCFDKNLPDLLYLSQMGSCVSGPKKQPVPVQLSEPSQRLNSKQKEYLSLIYWDLANRNKLKTLDQHHFALFFELTGLWGDKLFKYFAVNGKHEITLPEFLNGMKKIIRAPFQEKTEILFNFIKNPTDEGIKYKQFLKMLYHYSKPQLKQIMTNDGVFVHEAIIPSSKQLQKEKQSGIVHLKHEPSFGNIQDKGKSQFEKAFEKISKGYQDPGTLINFQTQKITYQVSYCNMSSLTKQYASHIFYKYSINEEKGSMNITHFKHYVQGNRKLFDTYFAVFHQNLWGWKDNSPLFIEHIQKQSKIVYNDGYKKQQGFLMLAINTLIISKDQNQKNDVVKMVYLVGVQVNQQNGKKMIIKDEPEGNNSTQVEAKQWFEELKSYSNNYFKNKYEILEQIGTGRYSIVYKCRERQTKKQYALKVLQWDKLQPRQRAAIQNQSQIMKVLKSHQFIKQYETIVTKKTIYIVSQYVYGEDLFQYVRKKKRLNEVQAAFLMTLIIEAVIHLHNIQIIHRDIKPENIMVSYKRMESSVGLTGQCSPNKMTKPKPQKIKLIDFGFANYLSVLQERQQEVPVGTLGYMAPQILLGEKPSFQNDTFSVGCIMYFLLRGKYPFSSNDPEGTAILTVKGEYSLYDSVWQQISTQAKQLIDLFLKTDPAERITLKEALNHPWFITLHNYGLSSV